MKPKKKNVIAIILGGGQGSRLYPLTESRSKPAVPIGGKYRLVDIPISNCMNSDIYKMFVLTQFNSASLNAHIKNTYNFSIFSQSFVDILAAEQTPDNPTWFQGTADAVRQCMPHFLNHDFDYALILSGDQLYQMDFNEMLEEHIKNEADISIATLPVNEKDAPEFGILKTNSDSLIESFIEKPAKELLKDWTSDVSEDMKSQGKHYLASMGIYIFNRQLLKDLMANPDTKDFGKEIIPQAVGQKKILSYQYEGYWTDIGNIDSFFEANIGLTDDIPQFNLFDNHNKIYTRPRLLPPSKFKNTLINKSLISEGCILNAKEISHSVIGIRSRIGEGTVIQNSYIMGNDFYQNIDDMNHELSESKLLIGIGENCFINNTIVDKDCRIGNNVYISGGQHLENVNTDLYSIKDGIVVVKKGANIPNNFEIK
ncbi:glucose-1-phosphate adenylyltransferase [Flavobacterium branchiophilum NBRC 15030 = ATCC 35035]|uniref:Glucose-1-phosphate adenylyltransferase n=2 Tax=Flavobacterium branchiophilum TaxID=55197 RepID=G2Z0U2_FLABF|nr:glucose-1-phosphate adenylyltransferase [Flavobacterium branchiophilum]OXA74685.1 glucose-1-phosphate adenylyltransferase [Flavobacterium branchiophilum NBRC 15030 = ATCC 35035]PDS26242.1 glucose-1-phosphate adenylyltransferase [Flavobacterium branchiophilum]TQM41925.1 glucose-1-phosphate adenylyltransferase [Flavobacterium branchiophilum]CCB69487.1 Glucose-1-phosphate adenylyltransferase [Flavobacterium branchiophilum FL-15]GEM55380.1 glucose-1-phosphate adenylyltransferase [Flavobacterium